MKVEVKKMRLEGKTALISGGGTGIGAAIAARFVREGAKICITGRRKEMLDVAIESFPSGSAATCQGDVANGEDVKRMVATAFEFGGRIDVLVNNAGVGAVGGVVGHDIDLWHQTIEINLTGPFLLMREAIPRMIKGGGGSIISISSVAGLRCSPESAAYSASKAGLIMLAQQIALDYGKYGIRSNVVCPGWVRTPMSEYEMDELSKTINTDREGAFKEVTKYLPINQVAVPDDVASLCLYLASDESRFVTGATLVIDGGGSVVDAGTLAYPRG